VLSVLSCPVWDIGALWPNGQMDQDETWHRDRPQPWPHCVRWGRSSPQKGHVPQSSAHVCCGQTARSIKMPLGMEVGLGPDHSVRWGPSSPSPKRGQSPLPNFRPMSIVAKRLDESKWHLAWRIGGGPWSRPHCARWGPSSLPQKGRSPPPNFRPISIVAKRLDASRCHLIWR